MTTYLRQVVQPSVYSAWSAFAALHLLFIMFSLYLKKKSSDCCTHLAPYDRTRSYRVLYLFLKNKMFYKILYFIEGLIFF